jgi:uncharacterized membrane protein YgcG
MKQFECINTFTSQKEEYYAKGTKIYETEFYALSSTDKSNFKEVHSDMEEFQAPPSKGKRRYDDDGNPRREIPGDDWGKDEFQQASKDVDEIYGGNSDDFDFGGGSSGGAGASDDY